MTWCCRTHSTTAITYDERGFCEGSRRTAPELPKEDGARATLHYPRLDYLGTAVADLRLVYRTAASIHVEPMLAG